MKSKVRRTKRFFFLDNQAYFYKYIPHNGRNCKNFTAESCPKYSPDGLLMRNLYGTSVWPCQTKWMCCLDFFHINRALLRSHWLFFPRHGNHGITRSDVYWLGKRTIDLLPIIPWFTALLRSYWFFFFKTTRLHLLFLTSFCDITRRSMLRLAEGIDFFFSKPHASTFFFNLVLWHYSSVNAASGWGYWFFFFKTTRLHFFF